MILQHFMKALLSLSSNQLLGGFLTSINAELLQLQAFFAPRPPSTACVR